MSQGPSGAVANDQKVCPGASWSKCEAVERPTAIKDLARVVVVTGVSSGIGHAIAKELIGKKFHVFGSVRKETDAQRLRDQFVEYFTPLLFDVTDEVAVQKAAAEVRSHMKEHTLLGLVNNAGIHVGLDATADLPLAKLRKQLEVNLVAQMSVIQAFLPLLGTDLTLNGKPGRILNNTSIYGSYTLPFMTAYAASKAALNALSEGLHCELKPFGIPVIVIAPGPIKTEIWEGAVQNAQCIGHHNSPFDPFVQYSHKVARALTEQPGWFLPASAVGRKVCKVLTKRSPALHYVITPNWCFNWFGPVCGPKRVVNAVVTRIFGLHKTLKRGKAQTGSSVHTD
ncbi:g5859 [Coccomyxa elongata]